MVPFNSPVKVEVRVRVRDRMKSLQAYLFIPSPLFGRSSPKSSNKKLVTLTGKSPETKNSMEKKI